MEYKKNQLRISLLISVIFFGGLSLQAQKDTPPLAYSIVPIVKDLRSQKFISQCRLAIIPAIIAVAWYCNQISLTETIQKSPLLFSATAYFLGNFVIDSMVKYQQINQVLGFFLFSQTMSRYLLC